MVNIKNEYSFAEFVENNFAGEAEEMKTLVFWANTMQWMFGLNKSVYKVLAQVKDEEIQNILRVQWKKYYDAEYKRKLRKGKANHLNEINVKQNARNRKIT